MTNTQLTDRCCEDCFVPSRDVQRGHTTVAVPESCGDEDCPCHTPTDDSVVDWEKEFDGKFPDGLWDCLPDNETYFGEPRSEFEEVKTFIRSLLTSQSIKHKAEVEKVVREERERIQATLKGHITSAVDFAMYCAKGNQWDVDHRETYAREVEKKLLALTNKE